MEILEELLKLRDEINERIDCIFVEGKKDKEALRLLGVKSKILYPNDRFNLSSDEQILILTDFDKEGMRLNKFLTERLENKARINHHFRRKFKFILKSSGRTTIESINKLIKNNMNVKLSSI